MRASSCLVVLVSVRVNVNGIAARHRRLLITTMIVAVGWVTADGPATPFSMRQARAGEAQNPASSEQAKQTPPAPSSQKALGLPVTRADLAAAYLRLEQAYFSRPPVGEKIATINKTFDQATLAFFMGRNAGAIRAIDALTESLGPEKLAMAERAVASLKIVVEPPVWTSGRPLQATGRLTSIYEWPSAEPIELKLQLRLVEPGGRVVFDRTIAMTVGPGCKVDATVPLELPIDRLKPGLYRIELGPVDGRGLAVGRVSVVDGVSLDEQRAANERRLAQVEPSTPQIAQALATCRARNRLLNDRPSDANSAQFLTDLNALAGEVASETQILVSGKDPYSRRRGDYWRVLQIANGEIPLRIYAPEAAMKDELVPLLIVLHGMGGDENMFLEAYGAGAIKQIADNKGLLIASPLTYKFSSNAKTLDALIEALSYDYAIDRDRVYVLGHSLGAGATAGLARGRGDTIAAACCIAGGTFQAKPGTPPVLVVSPDLDGVVPPKALKASAENAAAAGMSIELRIMPGYGHTLAVGTILPEAINWLLHHRRAP
jgi:predicted esterase